MARIRVGTPVVGMGPMEFTNREECPYIKYSNSLSSGHASIGSVQLKHHTSYKCSYIQYMWLIAHTAHTSGAIYNIIYCIIYTIFHVVCCHTQHLHDVVLHIRYIIQRTVQFCQSSAMGTKCQEVFLLVLIQHSIHLTTVLEGQGMCHSKTEIAERNVQPGLEP